MDDQPLLVLHIVRVKSWYVISMEKNKTIQKKLVLNSQKSMPQIIQILSNLTVRHFGTKEKKPNEEKMHYLQENLKLHFQVN